MIDFLIFLMFLSLTAANFHYLFYFKNKAKKGIIIEEKDNYYKLDAKIEFQKYLIIAIISAAGFFGIKKFSDLSDNAVKIEKLETSYENLKKSYTEAQINLEKLENRYAAFDSRYATFDSKFEKDLLIMEFKVQDATRQLPEPNIIAISKLLAQAYLAILNEHGPEADHIVYSPEYIEKESEKIIRLLNASGLTSSEAREYFNEIKKSTPKLDE